MPTLGLYILMNLIPGTVHFSMKLKLILYGIVISDYLAMTVFFSLFVVGAKLKQKPITLSEQVLPYFFTAFSHLSGFANFGKASCTGYFKVFLVLGISLYSLFLFYQASLENFGTHGRDWHTYRNYFCTDLSLRFKHTMDRHHPDLVVGLIGFLADIP